jgi:hypothetical protein
MPATTAQELLREVVARYAAMSSYMDSGVVRQWFKAGEAPHETQFSTSFKKPAFFRFEFSSPHPFAPLRHIITRHVVGSDGKTAYSLTKEHEATPHLETEESLSMAVAGATGISVGAAHTIGRLLLPEVGGVSLLDLIHARFKEETEVDSVSCYCISARHPKGPELELWVETDTLVIRKLIKDYGEVPTEEFRQNISVDQQVDVSVFGMPVGEI